MLYTMEHLRRFVSLTDKDKYGAQKADDIPWAWVKRVKDLVHDPPHPLPTDLPVEIIPWLYLSDEKSARDYSKIQKLGITHVLSVNGMPSNAAKELSDDLQCLGVTHKHVSGEDEEGYDMLGEHWEECLGYLREVREGGGKALVHCVAGINRSGLIVCAAHMVLESESILDVVEGCVRKRGMVLWNRSFQEQLCVLAAKEGLLGNKPEGYSDDEPFDRAMPPAPLHRSPRFNTLFDKL